MSDDGDALELPESMPVLPVRNVVMLPRQRRRLDVGRPASIALVTDAMTHELLVAIVTQRDPTTADPSADDLLEVGCAARIEAATKVSHGYRVDVVGVLPVRILAITTREPYLVARVAAAPDGASMDASALVHRLVARGTRRPGG